MSSKGKRIVSKDKTVLILPDKDTFNLSEMKGGKIITCVSCGKQEVVKDGSYCDIHNLCIECARKHLS